MRATSVDNMMRFSTIASWVPLALAVGCLGCLGCGDLTPVGYVSGKTEYDGKPVPAGNKVFFEGNGYLASAVIQDDGSYTLSYKRSPEIPLGDYVVFVGPPTSLMTEGEFRALEQKVAAEYRQRGKKPPPFPDWVLPARYYQSTTSPLRETVEAGDNLINLSLED